MLKHIIPVLFATSLLAQNEATYPPICGQYKTMQVPAADLPSAADRAALAGCDAEQLYFGFDRPADPATARKCAYLQREVGLGPPNLVFGSSGLLAMIYANGLGAERNFDLAIKFTCEDGWAQAENYGRVEHLLKLKSSHWTGDELQPLR